MNTEQRSARKHTRFLMRSECWFGFAGAAPHCSGGPPILVWRGPMLASNEPQYASRVRRLLKAEEQCAARLPPSSLGLCASTMSPLSAF
jgi:hypothetical protein